MGGISLGKAVTVSGLLDKMDEVIRDLVQDLNTYSVVLALCVIVLVRILHPSSIPLTDLTLAIDRIDIYQPHNRERPPSSNRQGSRQESSWKSITIVDFRHCQKPVSNRSRSERLSISQTASQSLIPTINLSNGDSQGDLAERCCKESC